MQKEQISSWFKVLQGNICTQLELLDGKISFGADIWERPEGGGGCSRVASAGNLLEKGGVMFSAVHGELSEQITRHLGANEQHQFYATGVSIVLHPANPHAPIIHMNVRYFEMSNGQWWFGGGIDLTPHYVDGQQARDFHLCLKNVCDRHSPDYYPKFKKWADDYFYLKHRNETRGIGGIFFDRLTGSDEHDRKRHFEFVQDVGSAFVAAYTQASQGRQDKPFTEREKKWQLLRRSRYVEFNLLYDQGTKFGLDSGGRIESILVSMPPLAAWAYQYVPEANSPEEATIAALCKGIDWVSWEG